MTDDTVPRLWFLLALIILVILSGFFSAAETAFSCASRIKLRALSGNGNKRAKKVLHLAEDKYDQLITTILVGNNIVNLTAATISALLFDDLLRNTGVDASVISTIAITLTVLIFGEITPKFIAKVNPEKTAMTFYPLLIVFYYLLSVFHFIFSGWKWLISKIFRLKSDDKVTEEEIMTVVEEAEEDGTLRKDETRLIRSVIEFDDVEVGDILVPRVNIVAVEAGDSMEDIKKVFEKEGFSRLPVYNESIDTIIGTIHEKDFFGAYLAKAENVSHITQKAFYTTEHIKISKLLKQMQKNKVHIAVVLDEYGGTLGLVTLEDVLEELVGEIWDEHDEEINYYRTTNIKDVTLVDANAPIAEFFEHFGHKDEDEQFDASTLSGWVIEYLGEIPRTGRKFDFANLTIEVMKATVKRVLEVRVTVNPVLDDSEDKE